MMKPQAMKPPGMKAHAMKPHTMKVHAANNTINVMKRGRAGVCAFLRSCRFLVFVFLFLQFTAQAQLRWPEIGSQTRPWTRWWWMGSAVDRENLSANMEKYKAAGLGGLELTPIYGVKGYEDKFIDYLSPRWMDMLSFTLQEARRLGLGLDMTTGTGWPFGGGPLIDSTYACKEFFYRTWTLKGGEILKDTVHYIQEALIHTDGFPKPSIGQLVQPVFDNKGRQALALDQVRWPGPLALQVLMAYSGKGEVLDLTDKVDANGHLNWTAPGIGSGGAGSDWTLYAIFQGAHGKMVERAAPGAEGNVIDHFSAKALKKYLSRFDTAFEGHNLSGLRSFFSDSYEVDDARGQSNWTPGFFELFRQHRGYDLRQHLPALFGKDAKENNDRVLCDYRETISDLLLEQFTIPWKNWARTKGALIRNQAHGAPANILDLYAASDIPETEGGEVLRYKFATSAAHVTGKKLVSSESVTWLDEHFLSTFSDVRHAVDKYLLGGVNHIFYHGTAYTPMNDPWPGWLFYASVHFTPNDPSWKNFSTLNEYIARCQSFLQQGAPDNDILLYYPMYDSWSARGAALLKHYDRMEPEFNGTGFKECAEVLQRKGYAFDYISDKQLRQTTSGAGADAAAVLTSGGGSYRTVLLPDCRYLSVEAMDRLIRLAGSGARILVYKALPSGPPGYGTLQERTSAFQALLTRLRFVATKEPGIQKAIVGKGAFFMGDDIGRLLGAIAIRREALVDDSLDFVRRKYQDGNVYFIVNHNNRRWEGFVPLSVGFRSAAIFDPMTGRDGLAAHRVVVSGGAGEADGKVGGIAAEGAAGGADSLRKVYLELDPGASCLVQTSGRALRAQAFVYYHPAGEAKVLKGSWKVEFIDGGPRLPAAIRVDQLKSWTAFDEKDVKDFSGTAKYTIAFARPMVAGSVPGSTAAGDGLAKTAAGGVPEKTVADGGHAKTVAGSVSGKAVAWLLDLGKVDQTAQVFLNGSKLATLIGPDYKVVIPAAGMRSVNVLEIRVSNRMVNRIEEMDRQGIVWKKFYNTNFPAHERANRGANGLFDTSKWAPLDAGLSGPVTLTPLEVLRPQGGLR
jgi:hypothetical protein